MYFEKAMAVVEAEFKERVRFVKAQWLPARRVLREAFASRFNVDASGLILELRLNRVPWRDDIFDAEMEAIPDACSDSPAAYKDDGRGRPLFVVMNTKRGWVLNAIHANDNDYSTPR